MSKQETILSVVENVYHQRPGMQPTASVSKYTLRSDDGTQPYRREEGLDTGGRWQPLELMWFKDRKVSLLVLANKTLQAGPGAKTRGGDYLPPTLELLFFNADNGSIKDLVHIPSDSSLLTADILLPPGESCRFRPNPEKKIWVRTVNGAVPYVLTVYP